LTTAVEVGLALAVVIFVKRMRDILTVTKVLPDLSTAKEKVGAHMVREGHDCPQISIYTIEGPLFFGAADTFEKSIMDTLHMHPKVLLLRMAKVPFIDATGAANLAGIVGHFAARGGTVLISGIQPQPRAYLRKIGLDRKIGEEHFTEHTGEAITRALGELDRGKCRGCKHFAFRECSTLSAQ
jgi:SulP family sulfate permease